MSSQTELKSLSRSHLYIRSCRCLRAINLASKATDWISGSKAKVSFGCFSYIIKGPIRSQWKIYMMQMLTCPCQPRPTTSNGVLTSRYQKNCSSQLFCYLLSLTPVLIYKYWLLKVQTLITWSCDILPGDQHTIALRTYWLWWSRLLRKERFLSNSPRCRDLQLQLRQSCPGPQGSRWQTCNEKLMPLREDFSR